MKGKSIFRSTIVRIIAAIILLVLPVNMLTLVFSVRAMRETRAQSLADAQDMLEMGQTNIEDALYRINRKLIYLRLDDTDYIVLATGSDKLNLPENTTDKGVRIATAMDTLESIYNEYSMFDLVYYYFPNMDTMLSQGHIAISNSRDFIKNQIEITGTSKTMGDFLYANNRCMMFTMNSWGNTNFGCLIDLENLLDEVNLLTSDSGRTFFFADASFEHMTSAGQNLLSEHDMTYEQMLADDDFEVLTASVGSDDVMLVEVIDWKSTSENIPAMLEFAQILSLVLAITVIPMLIWYMYRQVIRPINKLTRAIDAVNKGDLDYHISIDREGREFEIINQNFNAMLEQVKDLKIDVYEQELRQKNITMRYLSQQIQPHFILNALNIIYSYEPDEYPLIQKMVLCMSKYFRYIVKTNARFVQLSQEMNHIKNYFEIQQARFPGLFFSIVEYEEELAGALIPPLIVQNFAENSIKHSLKIGNKISIFVISDTIISDDGEKELRIRLADTGEGISDDILRKIDRFRQTGEHQEGLGIGIENSIERLKYLYGDKSSLRMWRDQDYHGTTVEIILPLHFDMEEEEI